jgi:hypothetical protein
MEKERTNALEMGKEKKEKNKESAEEKGRRPLKLAKRVSLFGICLFSLFR